LYVFMLLLPAVAFQGYWWLPLWWLALLFLYMQGFERAVAAAIFVGSLLVGPVVSDLDARILARQNPLFRAGVLSVEGGPDARAQADRLSVSLTKTYDSLWKYDKGDYAVVDMGLDEDDLWTKFAGTPAAIRQKNAAGKGTGLPRAPLVGAALVNRFVGAIGV